MVAWAFCRLSKYPCSVSSTSSLFFAMPQDLLRTFCQLFRPQSAQLAQLVHGAVGNEAVAEIL